MPLCGKPKGAHIVRALRERICLGVPAGEGKTRQRTDHYLNEPPAQ